MLKKRQFTPKRPTSHVHESAHVCTRAHVPTPAHTQPALPHTLPQGVDAISAGDRAGLGAGLPALLCPGDLLQKPFLRRRACGLAARGIRAAGQDQPGTLGAPSGARCQADPMLGAREGSGLSGLRDACREGETQAQPPVGHGSPGGEGQATFFAGAGILSSDFPCSSARGRGWPRREGAAGRGGQRAGGCPGIRGSRPCGLAWLCTGPGLPTSRLAHPSHRPSCHCLVPTRALLSHMGLGGTLKIAWRLRPTRKLLLGWDRASSQGASLLGPEELRTWPGEARLLGTRPWTLKLTPPSLGLGLQFLHLMPPASSAPPSAPGPRSGVRVPPHGLQMWVPLIQNDQASQREITAGGLQEPRPHQGAGPPKHQACGLPPREKQLPGQHLSGTMAVHRDQVKRQWPLEVVLYEQIRMRGLSSELPPQNQGTDPRGSGLTPHLPRGPQSKLSQLDVQPRPLQCQRPLRRGPSCPRSHLSARAAATRCSSARGDLRPQGKEPTVWGRATSSISGKKKQEIRALAGPAQPPSQPTGSRASSGLGETTLSYPGLTRGAPKPGCLTGAQCHPERGQLQVRDKLRSHLQSCPQAQQPPEEESARG